ncbi:helix-turn-helix domain-containing protein [Alloprevotella tannerae]|uniref:helix-turn-helix domain-containing protein n=1 Tax=Alloprevotella tannerae TaxID=76122 RepID=UPI0025D15EDC|nr:helix-turn-helix transcriptional regulator [Alloprevotella tannerae]
MEMKDRIRQLMEDQNLSQQEFAQRLNLSAASLSSIFTGRTNPTNKHVLAIHHAFPEVNVNWLLFGEGDKFNDPSASSIPSNQEVVIEPILDGGAKIDPSKVESEASFFSQPVSSPQQLHAPATSKPELSFRNTFLNTPIMNNIDKQQREIKEIRVFFDDGTYEIFVPAKR